MGAGSICLVSLDMGCIEKVRLVVGFEKEVEGLKSNLFAIKPVLVDAEKRQFKEAAVKQWIDKLKSICYDIDDVLDEWNAAILESQIVGGDEAAATAAANRRVCPFFRSSCFCFSWCEVGLRHDVAYKMQQINGRLNGIASQRNKYDFALVKDTEQIERPMSTSFFDKTESSEQSNPQVISLMGMGGIGKTTLAKLIYNEKRIWVCVSDPFEEIRIAKAMLESLNDATPNLV
ncbi:putative disease resistance protein RGA4 [Manihot esculenta]|uniref:putative disease resistance protein RGA4 n=1 Tax=Manihot esculenta TaxID=3983 RepID=UPI000B5D8A28|nr:putative disease resistance protein RGA4 [Manihot esculenta]